MKFVLPRLALASFICLLTLRSFGTVRLFVQDDNGRAVIHYECTAGEIIRAFAIDVSVDQGQIVDVLDFHRGPSTVTAPGYGIFPASFRDNIKVSNGIDADWSPAGYTPLAVLADNPNDTLPGLGSRGVTLEFGGLWDPTIAAAGPAPAGVLCSLGLSGPAKVSISPNTSRGGIVSAFAELTIVPEFTGALVGPGILSVKYQNGLTTIVFQDGQLQRADSATGPWEDTEETSGTFTESSTNQIQFYRVQGLYLK
jgi:hypothetical protein